MFASTVAERGVRHRVLAKGSVRSIQPHTRGDRARPDVIRGHHAVGHDSRKRAAFHTLFAEVRGFEVLLTQPNVEKRGGVLVCTTEGEAVGHVIAGQRAVILHVNLIPYILPEGVKGRTTLGQLKRDVVGDKHYAVLVIGVHEGVHVGIVGQRVVGN